MFIEEITPSVEYVNSLGTDLDIVKSAQITFNSKKDVDIQNFLEQLIKNGHLTPFEFCVYKFKVTCSLYTARQWMRHRTGTYSEISGRHVLKNSFIVPNSIKNSDETIQNIFRKNVEDSFITYESLINDYKVKKEDARTLLPLCTATTFLWEVNLRNLFHFLELRIDNHAQEEIRNLAKDIQEIIKKYNPISELANENISFTLNNTINLFNITYRLW